METTRYLVTRETKAGDKIEQTVARESKTEAAALKFAARLVKMGAKGVKVTKR